MKKVLVVAGILLAVVTLALAQSPHNGLIYYVGTDDPTLWEKVASRYEMAITGLTASHCGDIAALNSEILWFTYNSGTDNYVSGGYIHEHEVLEDALTKRYLTIEEGYMHYWDNTRVVRNGDTLDIPGYGDGSATSLSQARIPVYSWTRVLTNFCTPTIRDAQMETWIECFVDTTLKNTDIMPDGIFVDNSAYAVRKYGDILSGGHSYEHPQHIYVKTDEFMDWYWQTYATFLGELQDTLEAAYRWCADEKRRYVVPNVAVSYTPMFASYNIGDILFCEYKYNITSETGHSKVLDFYSRDSLMAANGMRTWYSPKQSCCKGSSCILWEEAFLGSYALYLACKSPESIWFYQAVSNPGADGWDTLTWRGIIDSVRVYLGDPEGPPYLFQEGKDSSFVGYDYEIYRRDFANGATLVRLRDWFEDIDEDTEVAVNMDSLFFPLDADGVVGAQDSIFYVGNGRGYIFLKEKGVPSPPVADFIGYPLSGYNPLTVDFWDLSTNNPMSWVWVYGDGDSAFTQNPTHTYSSTASFNVKLISTNLGGSDSETKTGYITTATMPALTITLLDQSIDEGDYGLDSIPFYLYLNRVSDTLVTFSYATSESTAIADTDFVGASGSMTFDPGVYYGTLWLWVYGDETEESDEFFKVTLSGATYGTFADSIGVGTITDDDTEGHGAKIPDASKNYINK